MTGLGIQIIKRFRNKSVYVDFAKVFSTVSHNKLLIKDAGYMRWMSSFLEDRTQCDYIESDTSSFLPAITAYMCLE